MSVGSLVVDAAMRVMEIEEVFVARIAWGGHICARELKIEYFKEGISGTASITKSAEERSSIFVVGLSKDRMLLDCSWVMRCLVTSLASSLSGVARALVGALELIVSSKYCHGKVGAKRYAMEYIPANARPLSREA